MDIEAEIASYFINNTTVNNPYALSESEEFELQRKAVIYSFLTQNFPLSTSKRLSQEERSRLDLSKDPSLTYGEIEFKPFGEIFFTLKNRYNLGEGGLFYDLGSGVGKALVAAALLGSFSECIGIEILPSLHDLSVQLVEDYNTNFTSQILANPDLFTVLPPVKSILGDILKVDWSQADLVFVNSTCFSDEMVMSISEKPVRIGTLAISLTRPLSATTWTQLEVVRKMMSWGEATVYIQVKHDPAEQERLLKEFGKALDS
jgi:SAM-dependent methyltransferase